MAIVRYTDKQIEKYNRQKYIAYLSKVTKNLYKMFRDKGVTQENFIKKFILIKGSLDPKYKVELYTGYHKEVEVYIDNLYIKCMGEFILDDIRYEEMSNLNRLQKSKNASSYKKDKHKNSFNQHF